jgi:tetratricopeptide (TPR) repeat protein
MNLGAGGGNPHALNQALESLDAAIAQENFAEAALIAERALANGWRHSDFLNALAFARSEAKRFEEALALLDEALAMEPDAPHLMQGRAVCLVGLGRRIEALVQFDEILARYPDYAAALFQKGQVLQELGESALAAQLYEAAATAAPDYADPPAFRAYIAARQGQIARARDYACRALRLNPNHATARTALATADIAEDRLPEALERLEPLITDLSLPGLIRSTALALRGDVLDSQGNYADAFAAYEESKRLTRMEHSGTWLEDAANTLSKRLETLGTHATVQRPWTPSAFRDSGERRPVGHAFLLGFPRSGTTLLAQVLATHPRIAMLDERPLMAVAETRFLKSRETMDRLRDASDDELQQFREDYWRDVAARGLSVEDKIFIDKHPLASLSLPLIARLFPAAKILFAERDPRDVVLSCFRRAFQMNPAMYQFTTLDGAARFYDLTLGLVREYRRLTPMALRTVRHEALVANFDGECRAICEFLGIEFSEAMRDFALAARHRTITTPSGPQIRRGLNSEGVGHWRRYADRLAPVLPVLEPWIRIMGYEPV